MPKDKPWFGGFVCLCVFLIGSSYAFAKAEGGLLSDPPVPQATRPKAAKLARDLISADATVRTKTRTDLINGDYNDLSDDERLAAILPVIRPPSANDSSFDDMQGLIIEYLPRLAGAKAKDALPILLSYIGDKKVISYIRSQSAHAAAEIAPDDPAVVAALVHVIGDVNGAIELLGRMGAAAASTRPVLSKLLNSPFEHEAYEALGRILLSTSKGVDFIPRLAVPGASPEERAAAHLQLRAAAGSLDPGVRASARRALLSALQKHPADKDTRAAILTLTAIGPGSDPAMIQAIIDAYDASPYTARTLAVAELTNPRCAPIVVTAFRHSLTLTDGHWPVRVEFAKALAKIGPPANAAAPELLDALATLKNIGPGSNWEWDMYDAYLSALSAFGPDTPRVASALVELLNPEAQASRNSKQPLAVRIRALQALVDFGLPKDPGLQKAVLDCLVTALSSKEFASVASGLLLKIPADDLAPHAERFIPLLTDALLGQISPDKILARIEPSLSAMDALHALARLGPAARTARPSIQIIANQELLPLSYDIHAQFTNRLITEARKVLTSPPFKDP
jgi:hypothetical protein